MSSYKGQQDLLILAEYPMKVLWTHWILKLSDVDSKTQIHT